MRKPDWSKQQAIGGAFQSNRLGFVDQATQSDRFLTQILIKRDTGTSDLTDDFPIVAIGPPVLDAEADPAEASLYPVFLGVDPSTSSSVVHAICLGPVAQGETVAAVVHGVCVAKVVMNDPSDTYADVTASDHEKLQSQANPGRWKILQAPAVSPGFAYVYAINQTPGQEWFEDGSTVGYPSYINLLTGTGLDLQPNGSGQDIRLDHATPSNSGSVSTAGQQFAGLKIFQDGAESRTSFSSSGPAIFGIGIATDTLRVVDDVTVPSITHFRVEADGDVLVGQDLSVLRDATVTRDQTVERYSYLEGTVELGRNQVGWNGQINPWKDGVLETGLSDTLVDGSVVQGGVIISKGTGSGLGSGHTHTASQISDSTAAGRTLLTAADAAAQRTALALGSLATLSTVGTSQIDNDAVTLAKIADIANQRVLGNNSGASASPSELTVSTILDWIGSTRGQVLFRGSSNWSVISADNGKVLQSKGSSADPVFAAWITSASSCSALGSAYTVSSSGSWSNTGLSVTLPSAGTYFVSYFADAAVTTSTAGVGYLAFRLYNSSDGVVIANTYTVATSVYAAGSHRGCSSQGCLITVSASKAIRLEALRGSGPTYTVSDVQGGSGSYGDTTITYVKVAE